VYRFKLVSEFIIVDDFHGKSERGVKQELFAHFVLITMNRLCSNKAEDQISKMLSPLSKKDESTPKMKVNFKKLFSHSFETFRRNHVCTCKLCERRNSTNS